MKVIDDDGDDDAFDDDERKKSKKRKCVSNDRSGHNDQNAYRIIKIGAILAYFDYFKVLILFDKHTTLTVGGEGERKGGPSVAAG